MYFSEVHDEESWFEYQEQESRRQRRRQRDYPHFSDEEEQEEEEEEEVDEMSSDEEKSSIEDTEPPDSEEAPQDPSDWNPPLDVCHIDRLSSELLCNILFRVDKIGPFFRTSKRLSAIVHDNLTGYLMRRYGRQTLMHLIGYGSLCTPKAIDSVLAAGAILSRALVQQFFLAYSDPQYLSTPELERYTQWGTRHSHISFSSYVHIMKLAEIQFGPNLDISGEDDSTLSKLLKARLEQFSRISTSITSAKEAKDDQLVAILRYVQGGLDSWVAQLLMVSVAEYGMGAGWPVPSKFWDFARKEVDPRIYAILQHVHFTRERTLLGPSIISSR
jgi:hypothetical protein